MEELGLTFKWVYVMFLKACAHEATTHSDVHMDFVNKEQKSEGYRKLNPNGKVSRAQPMVLDSVLTFSRPQIPTLVDHQNNNFAIWESNGERFLFCSSHSY